MQINLHAQFAWRGAKLIALHLPHTTLAVRFDGGLRWQRI